MKNIYLLLSASLLITSCGPTNVVVQQSPPPVEDVSYQSFYDQLSPYGNWINYPGYGYVWMPDAGPDFRPYATNGNWVYTDAGWTWASNYSWGWAPFHYGRWFYENGYGWMWLPGNEWAPAWVSWRGNGEYYGWAPLGPQVSVNVALNSYNPPGNYWSFIPRQYMGNPVARNYYVSENRNVTIVNSTTIINNYSGTNPGRYSYAPGPDPNEVRRVSGNNFTAVQLREANTPGERISGSQYVIYHPRVSATAPPQHGDAGARPTTAPAPARYESFSNMHPSAQQRSTNLSNNADPVNNPRSPNAAVNQPANSGRPVSQNPTVHAPLNNPPANNPGPPSPGYGQPAVNQPASNHPANNPGPVVPNPNSNQQNTAPASAVNTYQNKVNHAQPTGHPANVHNPSTVPPPVTGSGSQGRPTKKPTSHGTHGQNGKPATVPPNKPDQKPAEKPKTQDGN
jgi:hypothetical protein